MVDTANTIYLGSHTDAIDEKELLNLKYANRHGLIAGATGTGKTVTLQIMAEAFSDAGVPVFMADIKGDLSGMCEPSIMQDFLVKRADLIKLEDYKGKQYPTVFWDLFGRQGHPIRTTAEEMGALLLSRLMELNDTQSGVLTIAFKLAREEKMPLLDMKDLQSLLVHVGERAKELSLRYGNISPASIGAIQRKLLVLDEQGGTYFFGEPALNIHDMIKTTSDGRGHINILAADELVQSPKLYATFLFWMLSELFEELPEAGDRDKPKMVFFFDEAHLLFNDAPKALLERIEQVVRLIRSKSVGVYFITQNPTDIPETVAGQLGNRVQHALRAFTPKAQKAVRSAAQTFRPNPDLDTEAVITQLGVGEALVSTLEKKGVPTIVQRTLIRPPASLLGPTTIEKRNAVISNSVFDRLYKETIDRESAYEILSKRRAEKAKKQEELDKIEATEKEKKKAEKKSGSKRQGLGESIIKSIGRSMGSKLGREIINALIKGFLKKK